MRPLFLFATGALLVVFLLEGIFRLLPVSTSTRTGYYIDPHILTYPAKHCFTISTGWDLRSPQKHCANNLGFIANKDFFYDPEAIALIGDSFVEANMLPVAEGLAAQLESKLRAKTVFALGGPGSNLLDYAERADFANKKLGIKKFIIIINRTDIRESLCGSGNIHAHCIDAHTQHQKIETLSVPSFLKQFFRESAFAQYVISQLRLDFSQLFHKLYQPVSPVNSNGTRPKPSNAASELVIKTFFSRLPVGDGIKFALVIDPDRSHLFEYGKDNQEINYLRSSAHQFGASDIDPTKNFQEFTLSQGIALEVSPYDKHWNSEAINIVAKTIADKLVSYGY